jgi:phage recombination protein Bet
MSDNLPAVKEFSPEDLQLIKDTVAKGATDAELKLFLTRCRVLGLNPLRPGLIHFQKYKNKTTGEYYPGTIIVGRDGHRLAAARTGKHRGTRTGTIYEDGKLIKGWAEAFREGWDHPARVEVSFKEYSRNTDIWRDIPDTMIQKVAECAALRMAFPDELGEIYDESEKMVGEVQTREPLRIPQQVEDLTDSPAFEAEMPKEVIHEIPQKYPHNYVFQTGGPKRKGKEVQSLTPEALTTFCKWFEAEREAGKEAPSQVEEDYDAASAYLLSL